MITGKLTKGWLQMPGFPVRSKRWNIFMMWLMATNDTCTVVHFEPALRKGFYVGLIVHRRSGIPERLQECETRAFAHTTHEECFNYRLPYVNASLCRPALITSAGWYSAFSPPQTDWGRNDYATCTVFSGSSQLQCGH